MLLLIPMLVAITAALLQGGSLAHMAAMRVCNAWLIVASFGIQLLLYTSALRHAALIVHWNAALYVGAIALALLGVLRTLHLGFPARLAALGVALNAVVIVANGGHMPANAAAMGAVQGVAKVRDIANQRLYGNTRPATSASRMLALSDIIPVPMPGSHGNVYSIGDVLLSAGVSTLTYRTVRGRLRGIPPAQPTGRDLERQSIAA